MNPITDIFNFSPQVNVFESPSHMQPCALQARLPIFIKPLMAEQEGTFRALVMAVGELKLLCFSQVVAGPQAKYAEGPVYAALHSLIDLSPPWQPHIARNRAVPRPSSTSNCYS